MDKRRAFCAARAALLAAFALCAGGRALAQGAQRGPEKPPILYAAGAEDNSAGTAVAMVWEIGGSTVTPIPLTDGTQSAEVLGIAESGGSLYAAGRTYNGAVNAATVWKIDGSRVTPLALTDGTQNAQAEGIVESGGSLYAAGFEVTGDRHTARVWKIDGSTVTPIPLTGGTQPRGWVKGIAESGGSIYAAGFEENSGGTAVAMVWKIDGSAVTPIPLTGGTRDAYVLGITAGGDSIYVMASEAAGDEYAARVWKIDGSAAAPIALTGETRGTTVWGIAESGGAIYAAGSEFNGDYTVVAMVWRISGSRVTPIPLIDGMGNSAEAAGIAESGGSLRGGAVEQGRQVRRHGVEDQRLHGNAPGPDRWDTGQRRQRRHRVMVKPKGFTLVRSKGLTLDAAAPVFGAV
ncbi:MAG: hypothetical protein LBK77_01850 [Spirochaetaceae bacterium]|nr:hypothetical protein [Spirochaetaceae bacterium]